MTRSCGAVVVAAAVIALASCKSSNEFNEDRAREAIEGRPITLEGEQVTLTQGQIDCGVQADLWEPPKELPPDRAIANLTAKGRDLKFNDDLVFREPNSRQPYIQVRGDLPLQVMEITSVKDGEDTNSKLVEAKAGVKIQHNCFPNALPLMGVRHGNFNAGTPVVFHMHQADDGWHVDKIVH